MNAARHFCSVVHLTDRWAAVVAGDRLVAVVAGVGLDSSKSLPQILHFLGRQGVDVLSHTN